MQAQALQKRQERSTRSTRLSDYIDVSNALPSPFNLFILKQDLEMKDVEFVHFFSYSIGKQRIVIWGVYDRRYDRVLFDGGCKYNTYSFIDYIRHWRALNFQPGASAVKDRKTEILDKLVGIRRIVQTHEDYSVFLAFKAWYLGNIPEDLMVDIIDNLDVSKFSYDYNADALAEDLFNILQLDKHEYDELHHEEIDFYLDDIYKEVEKEIVDYEKRLNLYYSAREMGKEEQRISQLFMQAVSRSIYSDEAAMEFLDECPKSTDECEFEDYSDEKGKCAVYNYGVNTWHGGDLRHPHTLR